MTEGFATKTVVTTTTVVSESLDNAMTVTKETVSRTVEQAASAVEAVTIGGSAGEWLTGHTDRWPSIQPIIKSTWKYSNSFGIYILYPVMVLIQSVLLCKMMTLV